LNASASLFDSGVWVALSFATHPHHAAAKQAFDAADSAHPAALCRITQTSFLRLITTPAIQAMYGSAVITNEEAWAKCQELLALPQVVWLNEPPGLEAEWKECACLPSASPKVWMDAYLAAFAITGGLGLVCLDKDFRNFEQHGLALRLLVSKDGRQDPSRKSKPTTPS